MLAIFCSSYCPSFFLPFWTGKKKNYLRSPLYNLCPKKGSQTELFSRKKIDACTKSQWCNLDVSCTCGRHCEIWYRSVCTVQFRSCGGRWQLSASDNHDCWTKNRQILWNIHFAQSGIWWKCHRNKCRATTVLLSALYSNWSNSCKSKAVALICTTATSGAFCIMYSLIPLCWCSSFGLKNCRCYLTHPTCQNVPRFFFSFPRLKQSWKADNLMIWKTSQGVVTT